MFQLLLTILRIRHLEISQIVTVNQAPDVSLSAESTVIWPITLLATHSAVIQIVQIMGDTKLITFAKIKHFTKPITHIMTMAEITHTNTETGNKKRTTTNIEPYAIADTKTIPRTMLLNREKGDLSKGLKRICLNDWGVMITLCMVSSVFYWITLLNSRIILPKLILAISDVQDPPFHVQHSFCPSQKACPFTCG